MISYCCGVGVGCVIRARWITIQPIPVEKHKNIGEHYKPGLIFQQYIPFSMYGIC